MSTPQEYWDMALIKTWRTFGTLHDAMMLFKSITGMDPTTMNPRLLRFPSGFVPYKTGMRYYISTYLSDMNDWFWATPPDKDVELFRKVTASKRDVSAGKLSRNDKDMANARVAMRKDAKRNKVMGDKLSARRRNSGTEWNVTK